MTEQNTTPENTKSQDAARQDAAPQDENKLIAERKQKLAGIRAQGQAFPNDFRRDAYAADLQARFADA
ncbi:hypothetical protein ABTI71_19325, partial [Acinetobacter baumannii]